MAKAQGIIGNFKGKIGNTVGYQLTTSNNKQTQGIRIYQPNVKNPKTSAQAEQRAKLAPINATYRALKMVIDRGNEGLPYGNKSRLAWLKSAFKASNMPWFEKGAAITAPVGCQLTKGSLPGVIYEIADDNVYLNCNGITGEESINTIGVLSKKILADYPSLKDGDQITIIASGPLYGRLNTAVNSFVINTESTEPISGLKIKAGKIGFTSLDTVSAGAIVVSREGDAGEHLRSTTTLLIEDQYATSAPYDAASKTAAIKSYMTSNAANTDWSEEPID